MPNKMHRIYGLSVCAAFLALGLLLTACAAPTPVPPTVPAATQPGPAATAIIPTATAVRTTALVKVDLGGLAQDSYAQVIAAANQAPDRTTWQNMPRHTRLTLMDYTIADHLRQPQVFVYPVKDLGANEAAGKAAADLQALLKSKAPGQKLPFLPLTGDVQVLYAKLQYLDFKNGQGVRYLTEYSNGMIPVSNHELFYTYQGITRDGKYYVAAVLPIYQRDLPRYETMTEGLPQEFQRDYLTYVSSMARFLDQQANDAFAPDLGKLDALIQSIEID